MIDPYDYTINSSAASNIASALNSGTNVTVSTSSSNSSYGGGGSGNGDITISSAINKTSGGDATLTLQAANNIFLNAAISSTNNKLNLAFIADSDADGGGFVSSNGSAITTNGGSLTFGNGATATIGGVSTRVGGDLYVDLPSSSTSFNTAGGNITIHGDLMIAAESSGNKLVLDAGNGDITVDGTVNSANTFTKVAASSTSWTTDESSATSGNSGTISDVGNSYLATSLSHLENSLIAYKNGTTDNSWIGGKRVANTADWKWSEGPEGLLGSGGLKFYTQNGNYDSTINLDVGGGLNIYGYPVGTANVTDGGTTVSGVYNNWTSPEPTTVTSSSAAVKISGVSGSWSAANTSNTLNYYIKETNLNNATLDAKLNGTFKVNNHNYGNLTSGTDYGNIKSITLSKASSSSTPTGSSEETVITTATSTTPTAAAITMVQASVVNSINSNNITPHTIAKKHDGVKNGDMITAFNNKNSHPKNAIDTAKSLLESTDNNLVLISNVITK